MQIETHELKNVHKFEKPVHEFKKHLQIAKSVCEVKNKS